MNRIPTGMVAFLFTDIEGSTKLWEQHDAEMRAEMARHDATVAGAIARHDGHVFSRAGDSFGASFDSARHALTAAVEAQRELESGNANAPVTIRVRMGVHVGEAHERGGDYFGSAVNRAARIADAGNGGQIVISSTAIEAVGDPGAVRFVDQGEHRLKDLDVPLVLHLVHADGLPVDQRPLRSLDAYPNNLPILRTALIGRDDELVAIAAAFTEHRLVTITGVGGVGKTRLALQAASETLPRYPRGAWFVDLAPIADPALIGSVLAAAPGVRLSGEGRPVDAVLDWVGGREALFVFDNCEHVIDGAAAMIDELLSRSPGIRVLATSREPLDIPGERVRRASSLGTAPTPAGGPSPAAGLMIQRIAAWRPDYLPDGADLAAIEDICRHLDGIPLAIELAAARVRSIAVAEVAALIDDRFVLLSGGGRTRLPRQRTLKAAVDWSWELLDEPQQLALARMAVFSGSFALEAAAAVCVDPMILDRLDRLVQASLLEHLPDSGRYRMLETIRHYAHDRLEEAGEVAETRDRHCAWFTDLVATLGFTYEGQDHLTAIDRMTADLDNIRAALQWSISSCDVALAAHTVATLRPFWWVRGDNLEGRTWAEAVLDLPGIESVAETDRAWVEHIVAITEPDHTRRAALLEDSLTIWRRLGNREGLIGTLNNLALVLHYTFGDLATARSRYEEALELGGDSPERVPVLANLAFIALAEGDTVAMQTLADDLITARTASGPFYRMWGLNLAGIVAVERFDSVAARALGNESLELATRLGAAIQIASSNTVLALTDIQSGDLASAADHVIRASDPDLEGGGALLMASAILATAIVVIGALGGLAEAADLSASLAAPRLSPYLGGQVRQVLQRASDELGRDRFEQLVHPDSMAPASAALAKAHRWLIERTAGEEGDR
jgi:predicted ATPase/class 3 adenylate cyclase